MRFEERVIERWSGTEWLASEIIDWRIMQVVWPRTRIRQRVGALVVRELYPR